MLIFQVIFKRGFTVKITIIDKKEDEEDEIIVKCSELDESLLELINSFKKGTAKLSFYQGSKIVFFDETDIYYFESVENRVFAYTESEVYEIKLKLYELEEKYSYSDYFRANKAVLVNLDKVVSVSPAFGGRFEATLKNDCKIIISRMYVPKFKEKLGI